MHKIGVVTITFNSGDVIKPFMECMMSQTYNHFILYIIDNISSDNTLQQVEPYAVDNRVVIIKNTENVGVATGNNQGIDVALKDGCDSILLLNNDVEFEDTLFEKLLQQFNRYPDHSMITCKMMYYFDKKLIWYAGSYFDRRNGWLVPHIGMLQHDTGQYDEVKTMEYAPTCCVLIKKEVFSDVGLMDEKYFAYFDDTDFFYRVFKHGKHKLLYYPFISFYHKVGSLSKSKDGTPQSFKFGNFHIRLSTRNKVYYLRKQKNLSAYLNIIWFFFRMQLRFLGSGKYHRTWNTYTLLIKSFFEGMRL